MSLQRKSPDSFIYEATFHYRRWGGDFNFWYGDYTDPNVDKKLFLMKYFTGVTEVSGKLGHLLIPGDAAGYYKVTVDLKDGFTFNTEAEEPGDDGPVFVVTPKNGKKFTITFTAQ